MLAMTPCTLLLLAALQPCALALSQSKLSVHTGPNFGGDTTSFVSVGQPRIIKLFDSFDIADKIKQSSPGVIVIGRIYLQDQPMDGDPVARAQQWWAMVNTTVLAHRSVDYWEGYNEPDASAPYMGWYSAFEAARVQLMARAGVRAVIGCFSVGTPDVTTPSTIEAFYPAVDAALAHGGILGLHEYCHPNLACEFDNVTGEGWLTGRYRKLYREYLLPTGRRIPLAVTEFGIDGGAGNGGWRDYMPAAEYVHQLGWYDGLMRADDYVLGATIFLMDGTSDWDSFSVNGDAQALLAAYMRP